MVNDTGVVDDGVGATFLQSLKGELVAVEAVAVEGYEDAAGRAIAAVGGHAGMLLVEFVEGVHGGVLIWAVHLAQHTCH